MMLIIQIAKFKSHQYQMRPVLPNLMHAKITRYTIKSYRNGVRLEMGVAI